MNGSGIWWNVWETDSQDTLATPCSNDSGGNALSQVDSTWLLSRLGNTGESVLGMSWTIWGSLLCRFPNAFCSWFCRSKILLCQLPSGEAVGRGPGWGVSLRPSRRRQARVTSPAGWIGWIDRDKEFWRRKAAWAKACKWERPKNILASVSTWSRGFP